MQSGEYTCEVQIGDGTDSAGWLLPPCQFSQSMVLSFPLASWCTRIVYILIGYTGLLVLQKKK